MTTPEIPRLTTLDYLRFAQLTPLERRERQDRYVESVVREQRRRQSQMRTAGAAGEGERPTLTWADYQRAREGAA